VFEAPLIGVPLLIVVVVVGLKSSRKGWNKHQERVIGKRRPGRERLDSRELAEVLRSTDPGFDEAEFLARVERAFGVAQEAWCAQQLEPLRHFVTDGVFERFSLQVEEQREDGWRQGMEGLQVGRLVLVDVDVGRHFETATVRVPFRAEIDQRRLEDGQRVPGSRIPRNHFSECWSFVRRRGTRTVSGRGLIEGHCPHCGAPLSLQQSARCESCESLVRSGEFDWVLAEITQASEWRPERSDGLPGVAAYLERDPGFAPQLVEDRSSVAFWRKAAADRRGDVEPLVRVAEPTIWEGYRERLIPGRGGERSYVGENAVGSVRTLGVLADEEADRVVIEVVSDGSRVRVDDQGRRRAESARHLRRELFVLRRPAGARTDLRESFTSARCRSCGARDAGGTDPRCPYCEAPRTGGADGWMLAELLLDGSPAARALRAELAALPARPEAVGRERRSSADLVGWAAILVQADGQLDAAERRAMEGLARRGEVPLERLEELLTDRQAAAVAPRPRDAAEAREWLRTLVELALADGSLERGERRFLKLAARHLGLGGPELERITREARRDLYQRSRRADPAR